MTIYLTPSILTVKNGPAASPLVIFQISSAIPAKAITEVISKCRRKLKAWLEVSVVFTSSNLLCHLKLASMPVSTGFCEAAEGSMCFSVLSFVSILSNKN